MCWKHSGPLVTFAKKDNSIKLNYKCKKEVKQNETVTNTPNSVPGRLPPFSGGLAGSPGKHGNPYKDEHGHFTSKDKAVSGHDVGKIKVLQKDNLELLSSQNFLVVSPDPKAGQENRTENTYDNGLTISMPKNFAYRIDEIAKEYDSLPDFLKKDKTQLFFSSYPCPNDEALSEKYGRTFVTQATHIYSTKCDNTGDCYPKQLVYVWGDGTAPRNISKDDLIHEVIHGMDREYVLSDSQEYKNAVVNDKGVFVSKYAQDSYKAYKKTNRELSEDFSEAGKLFLADEAGFAEKFPNRANYFRGLFYGNS
jgi:hypothetical protein